MATRADLVAAALRDDGYLDGAGYNVDNKFSRSLGRGPEAWCGDFVTAKFREVGLPLPSMQDGESTGFSYCPSAYGYARQHGLIVNSWDAQPGDILLASWNSNSVADHTEIVIGRNQGDLDSIGGNSGVWHARRTYRGRGGVHQHYWPDPPGVGNSMILACLNADKLVRFGGPAPTPGPSKPGTNPPPWPGRILALKSPNLHGSDVTTWQGRMHERGYPIGVDGWYGPQSVQFCREFQQNKGLVADGQVGPVTWSATWTAPITP